jgi:hypothetical protein
MNVYNQFPDDDSDKEILLHTSGPKPAPVPRHISLHWKNGETPKKELVTQLVHLTGYFAYYSPMVVPCSDATFDKKFNFSLGTYTRAQRDTILKLAASVPFGLIQQSNDFSVWIRDLLESMVTEGILDKGTLTHLEETVPLRRHDPEDPSSVHKVSRFEMGLDNEFPDDDSDKEIFLQADSGLPFPPFFPRHVSLYWKNGEMPTKELVTQRVQLIPNYSYYSPVAKLRSQTTFEENFHSSLGTYTRAQRDVILRLAENVQFLKHSIRNDCRNWSRDLLESMVTEGLIEREKFDDLEKKGLFRLRLPEDL